MAQEIIEYPQSWEVMPLGEFVHSEKGKKPKKLCDQKLKACDLPYIDIQAFEKNIIKQYTDGVNCRLCKDTDILIVWDGSRSGLVGKGVNGALGSTLARMDFFGLNNHYAYYFLKSKYSEINSRAKGAATPHVDPDLLWNYNFPIPPLPEQHRIVEKIETLFSELDSGVENLKAAKAQLKRYRQSVLKSAFEGKLSEAWREAHTDELESAESLLERIKVEREAAYEKRLDEWKEAVKAWEANGKEGKKPTKPKKSAELPMLSDDEILELSDLPKTWKWLKTSHVIDPINNGYTPKANFLSQGSGEIPFIKVYNLNFDSSFNFEKDPTFIPHEIHEKDLARSICYPGDVLINIVGPPLGKVSIIPNQFEEWNINQAIVLFRPNQYIQSKFISFFMQTPFAVNWLTATSKATAGQYNVKVTTCRELPFILCSVEEQHQIVNEIESRLSEADAMEKAIDESLLKAERLRQSILKKAFEGKLVPQDENDEPASELLKRIQKER
jgi:type I restriction enzyme, S subunit